MRSLPKRTSVTEEKREKHNNDGRSEGGRRKKKAKEMERPESCRTMKRRDEEREGEGGKVKGGWTRGRVEEINKKRSEKQSERASRAPSLPSSPAVKFLHCLPPLPAASLGWDSTHRGTNRPLFHSLHTQLEKPLAHCGTTDQGSAGGAGTRCSL